MLRKSVVFRVVLPFHRVRTTRFYPFFFFSCFGGAKKKIFPAFTRYLLSPPPPRIY